MNQGKGNPDLSEARRRDAFRLLVLAQDMQMSVEESRMMVSEQYGLDEDRIRLIEREGLAGQWPPL
jgi:hypothetical protein